MTERLEEVDEMGPIDYLVVEYPDGEVTGGALPLLVDLVNRGTIRIIDLAFLRKNPDGTAEALNLVDLQAETLLAELALFEGAPSGLLLEQDLEEAAAALEPGSAAAVLVYENLWAAPFAVALRRAGARLVANGRIPTQELVATLDELEQHPVTT